MKSRLLLLVSFFSFLASPSYAFELDISFDPEKVKKAPALKNELLRDYFRRMRCAPEPVHSNIVTSRLGNPRNFRKLVLDRCVDIQIQNLLKETYQSLFVLDESWERAQISWIESIAELETDSNNRKQFLEDLKKLGDRAGDLKGKLNFLRGFLEEDEDYSNLDSMGSTGTMDSEMAYLEEQIRLASRSIGDYLFEINRTVEVSNLIQGNMLVRLARVEKLTRQICERQ